MLNYLLQIDTLRYLDYSQAPGANIARYPRQTESRDVAHSLWGHVRYGEIPGQVQRTGGKVWKRASHRSRRD